MLADEPIVEGKRILVEAVSLLIGLTKSIAPDRLGEQPVAYGPAQNQSPEQEQEQEQEQG